MSAYRMSKRLSARLTGIAACKGSVCARSAVCANGIAASTKGGQSGAGVVQEISEDDGLARGTGVDELTTESILGKARAGRVTGGGRKRVGGHESCALSRAGSLSVGSSTGLVGGRAKLDSGVLLLEAVKIVAGGDRCAI